MNDIFIDSDIILDLLLKRDPFHTSAEILFSAIEKGLIRAYTSPIVITNIYYISAKIQNKTKALTSIKKILTLLKISSVDEKTILLAAASEFSDFEDAIQYYSAKKQGIQYLITRNKSDYRVKDITICTPDEYIKTFFDSSQ